MFVMKSWRALFIIAAGLIAIAVSAWGGSVPQKINYQGTLNNKSGGPANGNFNMTFRIYSTATGTTPLWTETWNTGTSSPVVVTDGVFNVMLGSITPFSNEFFATHSKTYLGISVANDSEFLPRQVIGSVGYALAAGNGVPKGAILMWSGTNIPEGWALCDGTNGTPNLKDRFIVGIGDRFGDGKLRGVTGGEEDHVLSINETPSHTHVQNAHAHTVTNSNGTAAALKPDALGTYTGYMQSGYGYPTSSVTAINQYTGGNSAHNTLPPYYALAFIMKL
ncbi:hypothetical protein OR1_03641 [Geobacter sp. OR-1]|uniref:tail fiber protein n=1 Tax=Geobacter sp. OR-1 TaxID=1266765 RepID=UPI0005435C68|nr:tail fiber protein [Geobacter sp. OR-1]GAM11328.1 hypothetical protein OR1_03641 [Geobacter sp. OR-1]